MLKALSLLTLVGMALPWQAPPVIQNAKLEVRRGVTLDREMSALAAATATDPVWVAWRAAMVPGDRDLCSSYYDSRYGGFRGMFLDGSAVDASGRPRTIAPPSGPVPLEAGTNLIVLVRLVEGGLERVRAVGDDCPLDAGGRTVYWLEGVTAADSVRWLESLTRGDAGGGVPVGTWRPIASSALNAIALHGAADAEAILDRLAGSSEDQSLRNQAWTLLASHRGAHGFTTLKRLIETDTAPATRRQLVSPLAQTRQPGTVDALRVLARDPDARVRAEAIYWYAVRAGAASVPDVMRAIDADADPAVRRRAVSGLARLPNDEGVPHLITLARTSRDTEVRKAAVSALGQSKDPRATAFLEELLKRS